ncbi:uncharacterized protein TNCV_3751891 [Trichonephila clavipes]|nr:uncharacterized protein TNCV_3751891 [Trichonephila clavipes]
MTINSPTSPTEWLMVATRLMKTQAPKLEQNTLEKMCPFDQVPQIATLFDPTSKTLIEPCPQHLPNQHAHNFNNRGFRPNHHTHFQHKLPTYPCSICTQQRIPKAYQWKLQCPFKQHQLRQTPFTCDSSLANNTVSQSSENSVNSQQIPNQRQYPSTEASDSAY